MLRRPENPPAMPVDAGRRLVEALLGRKPAGLEILCCAIGDHTAQLAATERESIALAIPKRRYEFSTGRWLARRALQRLGLPPAPIPVGPEREPVWPQPAVGSLSHSGSTCVVALATAAEYEGIGIDLELGHLDGADIERTVLTEGEAARFASPELLRLAFCAKEAVFKCQFPAHRALIDYLDVSITLDAASRTFTAAACSARLRALQLERGHGLYEVDATGAVALFTQARRDAT